MYSLLAHEVVIFSLLLSPSFDKVRKPAGPTDQLIAIDLNTPAKEIYFPDIKGDDENRGARPKGKRPPLNNDTPLIQEGRRTKGLSYPGPQAIISVPPKADNRFQTLLQPALQDPPVLQPPVPLPNMIQSAHAGPLPQAPAPGLVLQAEPKPAEPLLPPTPLQRGLTIASPSQTTVQKPQVVLPASPLTPDAPGEKPIELTMVQKGLAISSPPAVVAPRPMVVLPLATSAPVVAAPEKPIELTAVQKDLTVPPPSQVVEPNPRIALVAPTAPSLPAPEKPIELTAIQKALTITSPQPVVAPQRKVAPPAPPAPALPAPERPPEPCCPSKESAAEKVPPQIAPVPTQGLDRQNLLSVTPLPAPPQPSVRVPTAEGRGRVAISPEPNLSPFAATPGVKADNLPGTAAGVEKNGDDAAGRTSVANDAQPKPSSSDDAGTKTGVGNGTSDAPPKSPFPGITIQGGRSEGGTGVVSTSTSPRTGPAAPRTPYSITIVSTPTSGGGLPDFGVFSREKVYTVYIDMKDKTGAAAPSWTLQYALAQNATTQRASNASGLVPPFPLVKEPPDFPVELLRKYARRLIVVYGVIDAGGHLQEVAVKQSPERQLNQAALAALSKWVFRPAELNGSPAPVKVLMGIPLALP